MKYTLRPLWLVIEEEIIVGSNIWCVGNMLFKRLFNVELLDGLENEKFLDRYDTYICRAPLGLFALSALIVVIWLVRADLVENISYKLTFVLDFLPKYRFELRWLPDNYPNQVDLYACLSFAIVFFTIIKTAIISFYIITARIGERSISVSSYKNITVKSVTLIFSFSTFLFLFPLPIYGNGASTIAIGNAFTMTALNIFWSTIITGTISATVLLLKRVKIRE